MVLNMIKKISNKIIENQTSIFANLCTPAQIEYVIGIISIVSLSISCLTQSTSSKISDVCTELLPYIITVTIVTFILNTLCKGGASYISWFMIILPIVLIITSITSKKTPEERFNYEVPKPALKMFLYPKEDMEIDEENNEDKVEIILPEGKDAIKIRESDIQEIGIDPKKIKSIQKHDDIVFVLFINSDCTGNRQIYKEDLSKLSSKWKNRIGSIYLFRKASFKSLSGIPVQVFEKPEYEGKSASLWVLPTEKVAYYNKAALKFLKISNNEISSIKNPKNMWNIQVFKKDDFKGKFKVYQEDQFELNKEINNKITSIKITRNIKN